MFKKQSGFALPTILISSIIMLTVLLASVMSTSALSNSISKQFYEKMATDASIAGKVYADTCIKNNLGAPWTNPLRPDTDCMGVQLSTCPALPADAPCHFLSYGDGISTTFSVEVTKLDSAGNVSDVNSSGLVNLLRKSDGGTWMTYNKSMAVFSDEIKLTWIDVATGYLHSCGITNEGKIFCWGDNSSGQLGNDTIDHSDPQLTPVAVNMSGVLNDKMAISISSFDGQHTCVIANDKKAYCWGGNEAGQLGNGTNSEFNVPVEVNLSGDLLGKTVKKISAGSYHTCMIASDDKVYCWGNNDDGQLGNNTTTGSFAPTAVDTGGVLSGKNIMSVSAGYGSTCVIASDYKAYCWGYNAYYGQLGNNSTDKSLVPVAVDTSGAINGKNLIDVSVGKYHACAVSSDGVSYCWGCNFDGQLGNNSYTDSLVPVAVDTSGVINSKVITKIAAGDDHTCAVSSEGRLYCWGTNQQGLLGDGSSVDRLSPVLVKGGDFENKTIISISVSGYHSCAAASDGSGYCWGGNYGALGDIHITKNFSPVPIDESDVPGGMDISMISLGIDHSCAISSNKAYCWGESALGQDNYGDAIRPSAVYTDGVLNGKNVIYIASDLSHYGASCVITSEFKAYCWGENSNGQLGNNSTTDSLVPVAVDTSGVLSGKSVVSISMGYDHTCAVDTLGKAYCWGKNTNGQLGNNSTTDSLVPVAVDTSGVLSGKILESISVGNHTSCALDSNGKAYCWGENSNGQLGNNSTTGGSPVPVAVDTSGVLSGKTIASISNGSYHTCVVTTDGGIYCWGFNGNDGYLGNNSIVYSPIPVSVYTGGVLNGKIMTDVSVKYSTCALDSTGKAYCWGNNRDGLLGDDSIENSRVPVAIPVDGFLEGKNLTSISVGGFHACAVDSTNKGYCWGNNESGENGSLINSPVRYPALVYSYR